MQETWKNYSAVLAAEPERTDARTDGSEFIGSFRSLTPGNQLDKNSTSSRTIRD